MNYLLKVQKAIAGTTRVFECEEYQQGWDESGSDLTYGVECGSEQAVRQQIAAWMIEPVSPYFEDLDSASDQAYSDRTHEIYKLITEQENE